MRVLLVDPSLFIAPYDSFLSEGLNNNGVEPRWATRRLRPGEEVELSLNSIEMFFYRFSESGGRKRGYVKRYLKGLEHTLDLRRLESIARAFDLVHFQFSVLPKFDLPCIRRLQRRLPVVLTLHDTTPFNGTDVNPLQYRGLEDVIYLVDHVIVHTNSAKKTIENRGIASSKVSVIPHGPLALRAIPQRSVAKSPLWRVVFFGRIQAYKGLSVLIEALGLLPIPIRSRIEVVIAGEPFIETTSMKLRVQELQLERVIHFRLYRLPESELAELLHSADTVVFPYLEIDASGAFFLAMGYRKWIIASDIGAFRETMSAQNGLGVLVPPGDAVSLAQAIAESIGRAASARIPAAPDWNGIGAVTANLYAELISRHTTSNR